MEDLIQIELGKRIRSLRVEKTALSQEKFANKIGIDRTYYSAIELGKHSATITLLAKIADGLGVSLEELLQGL